MVKLIQKGPFECGETPLVSKTDGLIYWVDAASHMVYSFDEKAGRQREYNTGLAVSAVRQNDEGVFFLLTKHGLYTWEPDEPGSAGRILSGRDFLSTHDSLRFNDGIPLSSGDFLAGTFDENDLFNDRGGFYRLNIEGEIEMLDDGLHVTNGVAVSGDEKIYYLSEMYKKRILKYEIEADGSVKNKSIHIVFGEDEGIPDGLLCDAEDNLWAAHWRGWKLSCYNPAGERIREIPFPAASPTCFCFTGPEMNRMIVTSALLELTDEEIEKGPDAGGLFETDL